MNGFNVKLKSLMEMFIYMLRHMEMFYLASIYIYIFILNYIFMHVLRHYESLNMCKECICVLMIK